MRSAQKGVTPWGQRVAWPARGCGLAGRAGTHQQAVHPVLELLPAAVVLKDEGKDEAVEHRKHRCYLRGGRCRAKAEHGSLFVRLATQIMVDDSRPRHGCQRQAAWQLACRLTVIIANTQTSASGQVMGG